MGGAGGGAQGDNASEAWLAHPPFTSCYVVWFLTSHEPIVVHGPGLGDTALRCSPMVSILVERNILIGAITTMTEKLRTNNKHRTMELDGCF